MRFRCSFQLPVLFQPSVVDEGCSEVHPGFPEFPGSRQGLSFGGVEACDFGKIDDEGADVGPVTGRCPGAQDAEDVEVFVKSVDHVLLDDLVGRGLWRGPGHEVQIMDMAGGDGVEDEALPQVIGVIELAVLDAGAGLENGEPCFDAPAALVEGDDLASLFGRRLALGGEQQPVEGLLVVWWGGFRWQRPRASGWLSCPWRRSVPPG